MANATVAIDVVADVRDATSGLDAVGSAAADMARDVDRAASTAGRNLDGIADGADNLDSKASQATGALGALASGFELAGAEKYAGSLQSAALATDFLSGVGAAANLVMNTQALTTAKATATSIAHRAATLAQRAATAATTAAQWALNVAMSANPIGLVIAAAVALVAGFVLLYKKSDTFRAGVQRAGDIGKKALGFIVDAAKDVRDWFGKLEGPARTMARVVKAQIDIMLTPLRTMVDLVKKVIDLIGKIDFPDVPDGLKNLGGLLGRASPSGTAFSSTVAPAAVVNNFHISGAVDKNGTARQIGKLLNGRTTSLYGVRYA